MKRARPLLGTYVEIEVEGPPSAARARAIDHAFDAVERVQRLMSFHDPASDLSRLNRRAFMEPVAVHPWTAAVLRRALQLFHASDGLFDCAVGHELVGWGLLPAHDAEPIESGSLAAVELAGNRVRFSARIALDLGGIAKGFAVDRAIAALRRGGERAAVVNAGGDLRAMGEEAHPVHVRDPLDPALLRPAGLLRNGAFATSSATATLTRAGGVEVSALLTGGARRPLTDRNAYSVIARACVIADALTKVLAQTGSADHPCFARFGASGLITAPARTRAAA